MTRRPLAIRRRLRRTTRVAPRDVFVVGTAYSGSTLLGNALNGHREIAHAGEISRLPAFGLGDEVRKCLLCATADRECPIWDTALAGELDAAAPGEALAVLRPRYGVPVLVDGSKHPEWLARCLAAPSRLVSPFVVLATRSPFAYADSARRRVGWEPAHAGSVWCEVVTAALALVAHHGLPSMVVRYEDFALRPAMVLARVVDALGLGFDERMLTFWQHDLHCVGGNAGAYVWFDEHRRSGAFATDADAAVGEAYRARRFGGWADEKWREHLAPGDVAAVLDVPAIHTVATMAGDDLDALVA